jgi:hypothetical protein
MQQWTLDELNILRLMYKQKMSVLRACLPGRTGKSIDNKRIMMGLRMRKTRPSTEIKRLLPSLGRPPRHKKPKDLPVIQIKNIVSEKPICEVPKEMVVRPDQVHFRRSRFAGMFLDGPPSLKHKNSKVLGECVTAELLGDPPKKHI